MKGRNFMLTSISAVKEKYKGSLGKEDMRKEIKETVVNEGLDFDFQNNVELARSYLDEVVTAFKGLKLSGCDVIAVLTSRLLTGSASGFLQLVTEVGMHWDSVLDLPFVPGSSLKGVMRSYALELCRKVNERKRCVESVLKVFGSGDVIDKEDLEYLKVEDLKSQSKVGEIVVSNAYPVELSEGELFEGDIVNPHYYSNGRVVKSEWQVVPNPITSLSVKRGVKFRFIIGMKPTEEAKWYSKTVFNYDLKKPAELAFLLLTYSLSRGIGSRTSKGYGRADIEVSRVKLW
ncbi:hypothetical protein HS7_14210 [Sulfolobales archaeon HS-7]|nr:hypothetical protein HS7_14210 [Sulfolobales archaeon HS-7]